MENQFDYAAGDVTYLSRANGFANYKEATAGTRESFHVKRGKERIINNSNYNPEDYNNEEDKMPETGAKNDIELADLRGVDYDDAKWDELLDNMTISDMDTVIALGGYQTAAASSVGKIQTIDCDRRHLSITTLQEQVPSDSRQRL